jgi:hypothetical protein
LTNLFDKSKGELNEQEQTQLSELLCEFEDVFAKSEFDLGKFNTIQHGIDTGTNRTKSHSSELKQPVFSNKCRFGAVFRFDIHLPIC